jgi:hypothetical protein
MSVFDQAKAKQDHDMATSKVSDSVDYEKVVIPPDLADIFSVVANNLPVTTTAAPDYPVSTALEGQLLPALGDVYRFAFIEDQTRIHDRTTGNRLTSSDFNMATSHYPPVEFQGKMKSWASVWLSNPNRPQYMSITYNPGYTGTDKLNRWEGWGYAPISGTVKPFLDLLLWVVGEEHAKTVLQWFAYPLQHPGKRSLFALVLISNAHGLGKGLLVKTVGKLHGKGFKTPSVRMVTGDFNGWAGECTYTVCVEFSIDGNRGLMPRLKEVITEPQIMINEKNNPAYMADNLASFVFLSNDHAALHIEAKDRRFYVIDCKNEAAPAALYDDFVEWRDNGGFDFLMHYLLNLDMTGYKANGHAPATADKDAMADLTATDLERWLREFSITAPKAIYTRQELRQKFEMYSDTRSTESAVGRALKRLGLGADNRITNPKDSKDRPRVVAIRDSDSWRRAGAAAWADAYYDKQRS